MELITNRSGIVALVAATLFAFAALGASDVRADGPLESQKNAALGIALCLNGPCDDPSEGEGAAAIETIVRDNAPAAGETGPVLELKDEPECVQIHKEFPCPEDEAEEDGPGDGCVQIHDEFPCPEPGEDEDEDTALQCIDPETLEPCESPDPGPDQAGDDGPFQLCKVVGTDDEGGHILECLDKDMPDRKPECIREFKGDCEDLPGDDPGDRPGEEPRDDPDDAPVDEPEDQPLVEEDEPAGKLIPGAPHAGGGHALGSGMTLTPVLAALALAIGGGILGGAAISFGRR